MFGVAEDNIQGKMKKIVTIRW